VAVEQLIESAMDQLPWAGLVNTSVSVPEKLSEAGVNRSEVDEVAPAFTFIVPGAVVVPSGRTQW
jgi:hypothetical protein